MRRIAVLLYAVLLLGSANLFADDLVTNGGFDTGDFAGWTAVSAASGSDFFVSCSDFYAHTPNCFAAFGAVAGQNDSISQTLSTVAGVDYTFSFWVSQADANGQFEAFWDGTQLLDLTGAHNNAPNYYHYLFSETATSTNTVIAFAANTPPGYYYLDDVSVVAPTPESSCITLLVPALLGMAGIIRRQRR
jgi:hypothetical protein